MIVTYNEYIDESDGSFIQIATAQTPEHLVQVQAINENTFIVAIDDNFMKRFESFEELRAYYG